jgi:hypothetical protein
LILNSRRVRTLKVFELFIKKLNLRGKTRILRVQFTDLKIFLLFFRDSIFKVGP